MAIKILKDFHRRLNKLERTRERMEGIYSKGKIARRDVEAIYESLFVNAVGGFERFLEDLFFAILLRKIRHHRRSKLLSDIRFGSRETIRNLLLSLQRDKFFVWLPYSRTTERAKLYLADGRPFSKLDELDKTTIATVVKIRNAIAHSSDHAMDEFMTILQSNPHSNKQRTPAGFLRYQFRISPDQNHFQGYMGALGAIAGKLCKKPEVI